MNYAIQMPIILQIIVITIILLSGAAMFMIESTERPLTITGLTWNLKLAMNVQFYAGLRRTSLKRTQPIMSVWFL